MALDELISPYPYEFSGVTEFKSKSQSILIDGNGRVCVQCAVCNKVNRIGSKHCSSCNHEFNLPDNKGWYSFHGDAFGGFCCDLGFKKVENHLFIEPRDIPITTGNHDFVRTLQPLIVDDLLIMAGETNHEIAAYSLLLKGDPIWKTDLYSPLQSYSQMALKYPFIYLTVKDPLLDGIWYFARISVFDGELEIIADFNEPPASTSFPVITEWDDAAGWLIFPLSNKLLILDVSDEHSKPPFRIYNIPCHAMRSGDQIAGITVGNQEIHILTKAGAYYHVSITAPLLDIELNGCKPVHPPRESVHCSPPVHTGKEVCFLEMNTAAGQTSFRGINVNHTLSESCLFQADEKPSGKQIEVQSNMFNLQLLNNWTLPFVVSRHNSALYLYRPNHNKVEPVSTHRPWDTQYVCSIRGQQTAVVTDGEGWLVEGIAGDAAQTIVSFSLYSGGKAYSPLFRPLFCFLGMIIVTNGKVFVFSYP